jgi:hypothetical protein
LQPKTEEAIRPKPEEVTPGKVELPRVPTLGETDVSNLLTEGIREKLSEELAGLTPLFDEENLKPVIQGVADHAIQLKAGVVPAKDPPRFSTPERVKAMREIVEQFLEKGIVERSYSQWCARPALVKKPDGSYRMVVDYRSLNELCEPVAGYIPKTSELLASLKGAKVFSLIDLKSAYYQVKIREQDRPLTAFYVPGMGMLQFVGLPMGLKNAVTTFNWYLTMLLDGLEGVQVYLDGASCARQRRTTLGDASQSVRTPKGSWACGRSKEVQTV